MPRPVLCKRDDAQEMAVQKWIEAVMGQSFTRSYDDTLKDGVLLCQLMNKLSPGLVPKINTEGSNFKMMENVNRFQQAMLKYGVDKGDIFQTNDLWEKKDMANVTNTLCALARAVKKHEDWSGPVMDIE